MTPRALSRAAALAAALLVVAIAPGVTHARGGGHEIRTAGRCGGGPSWSLRLRGRDGAIRVRFEVSHGRSRASWRLVLVQDRRVVARRVLRAGTTGALELQRSLRDFAGADVITARAYGPGGVTCAGTATLPG